MPLANTVRMAVIGVAVAAFGHPLHAQQTERLTAPRLLPDDTLVYLRIDDVQQLKEDLSKTSLGKMGADPKLEPILSEFYGTFVRATQRMQDVIGLNLDELLSIPSGEMALALLPSDRTGGSTSSRREGDQTKVTISIERPAIAMLLDAGDEITSVQILLQRMEQSIDDRMQYSQKEFRGLKLERYQNPDRRREQFAYFIDDGVMVACSDSDYIEQLAEVWLGSADGWKSLADNRTFTSIMSRCVGTEGERPQLSFYADPMAMVRQFSPSTMVTAILPALGLDGIEGLGGSWIVGPPNFDSIAHFHLMLDSPRRELLGLVRPQSGETDPEAWVPDTVASYSTINWDIASTFSGIERLYNEFRGEDAMEKQVFEPAKERTGVDIRKEIIGNLEGRLTMIQGFTRPVRVNSGSNVYAIKMKDAAAFESKTLPKLIDALERAEITTKAFGTLKAYVLRVGGRRELPPDSPIRLPVFCLAILDDYVVISDSEYMMRQVSSCKDSVTPKLRDAIEYQLISDRITSQLQERECAAISYSRPEETLQSFYELARDPKNKERLRAVADNNPFFRSLSAALEKHELPPFSVIAKYLAPGGGFLVDDESGMHYMSFQMRRE